MSALATRSLTRALLVLCATSLASSLYAAPLIKPVDEQNPASGTNANSNTSARVIGNSGVSTVPIEWTHSATVGTITLGNRHSGWDIYDWSTQIINSPATVTYKCSTTAYVQVFLWNSEPCKRNSDPISLNDGGTAHGGLSPSGDTSCVNAYCRGGDFHFFDNGWPGILTPAALRYSATDEFQLRINHDDSVTALANGVELATTAYPVQYPINVAVSAASGDANGGPMLTDMEISGGGDVSAVGDPHLMNIHGERFDLMQPGKHVLINVPRGTSGDNAMLQVQADARQLGGTCADIYFQHVNVTGIWPEAKQVGGYHYSASQRDDVTPEWVTFGNVELKVVHGRTDKGLTYLNVYVKHLGRAGFHVGGLLGEDDHAAATVLPELCVKRVSLGKGAGSAIHTPPFGSVAEANLA